MADEATPTPSSEPTDSPAATPTPSDPPADKPQDAPADKPADAPKQDEGDDLAATALGGKADDADADAPKDDDAAAKAEVPEAYELTPPEGFEKLDEESIALATPVFKELGLSNEQAQTLMPVAAKFAEKIVADRDAQLLGTIMDQRKDWLETAKKDPEMGGANWDATLGSAAKALDQLGFPKGSPLRVALDESGFGNHPELIRVFAKVGKAIGEDSDFARSTTGGGKKTDAEIFYGSQK